MDRIMQARAEHRVFRKMAREMQELAIQVHEDEEIVSYVKLSDVIEILQENAPMNIPLLDK